MANEVVAPDVRVVTCDGTQSTSSKQFFDANTPKKARVVKRSDPRPPRLTVGYKPNERTRSSPKVKWTQEHIDLLLSSYFDLGSSKIARITGRSAQAVEVRARLLGLIVRKDYWNEEMDNVLREGYSSRPLDEIGILLNKTKTAIHLRARILGLNRPRGVAPQPEKSTVEYRRSYFNRYAKRRFFYMRASKRFVGIDTASWALGLWRMWKQQRGHCALTGVRLTRENARLDHIVPSAQGGADVLENLQWVTYEANLLKGSRTEDELLKICRLVIAKLGAS